MTRCSGGLCWRRLFQHCTAPLLSCTAERGGGRVLSTALFSIASAVEALLNPKP